MGELKDDMISKCGMACNRCSWSHSVRATLQTEEEYTQFRKRCKAVLGYSPTTNVFQNCVGCQTPDEEIPEGAKIPLRNCLVRKCVDALGIENCAYCSRFPCGYIQMRGTEWNRENIEAKRGSLSEEDYLLFVEPFEGLNHLETVHRTISPDKIIQAITVPPLKLKVVDFPEAISLPEDETTAFRKLHTLLHSIKQSSLGLEDTDIYAQQQRLKKRMDILFRFLWICGRYGTHERENDHITVDSITYMDNRESEKALGDWKIVKDIVFKALSEFGIHVERVVITEDKKGGGETPGGYLRKEGWYMVMSLDDSQKGVLKALHTYANRLEKEYGKKAFTYFKNLDMHVLTR
ncbi:MAG: DUF3795 domain-containing protein [Theionarchaea archaeon]|nr:DUF3795 domain-containing protein [Theionarchaea archaeon]